MSIELFHDQVTEDNFACSSYLSKDNIAYQKQLQDAATCTQAFRASAQNANFPYDKFQRGYFLSIDSINDLINQNEGDISGLRIYFGETENPRGKKFLDLVIVATCTVDNVVVDYNVPLQGKLKSGRDTANDPAIGDVKPCPMECGTDNCLNS